MPSFDRLVLFITDFGDAAMLLPVSLAVFVGLMAGRAHRVAGAWALAIFFCILSMVALKLAFRTCGGVWTGDAVISPSGHTAFSTTVYGGLAGLVAIRTARPWLRVLAPVLAVTGIVGIGVSRLLLKVHTPDEVLIGWGVGAIWVGLLCALSWRTPVRRRALAAVLCLVLVLVFLLHGDHAAIEALLVQVAELLHRKFSICT